MIKLIPQILLGLLFPLLLIAEVTVSPMNPLLTDAVTVNYDASQGNAELKNCDCNKRDYQALRALYLHTKGDQWNNNSGWEVSSTNPPANCDFSNWYGVTCEDGRVVGIRLNENNLSGFIPKSIGDLNALRHLNLFDNQLIGNLPSALSKLFHLENLSLSKNQLSGTLLKELGRLRNLEELSLYNNQLTGNIPMELEGLDKIERLFLYDNKLTGEIPSSLGKLTNLVELRLDVNELTGRIPTELGLLHNLENLFLYNNQLTGHIPSELGDLQKMEILILYDNKLTGEIPSSLGNLINLVRLDLDINELIGEIPNSFSQLTKLEFLYLSDNNLTGSIPAFLGEFPLEDLWLQNNQFSGCLPASFKNLCESESILISGNPDLEEQDFDDFCNADSNLTNCETRNRVLITGDLVTNGVADNLHNGTTTTTASQTIFVTTGIKIYPNPTSGLFFVETAVLDSPHTLTVLNVHGQVVLTASIKEEQQVVLNIQNQSKGMYFVHLKGKVGTVVRRILLE